MNFRDDISAERLRQLLNYDPETGIFTRKIRASNVAAGSRAGSKRDNGYLDICINGRLYRAHRLAFLYVHGVWPRNDIDHINGVRDDNRIANLRDVTRSMNLQNIRSAHSDRSFPLGVSPKGGNFTARIRINGRQANLGIFPTPELAHAAYLVAKRKHHPGGTI